MVSRWIESMLLVSALGCAASHADRKPAPIVLRPTAGSSIQAVLEHRGELALTDDQTTQLEKLESSA